MKIALMNEIYDSIDAGGGVTRTYRMFTDYCIRKKIELEIFCMTKKVVSMDNPYHLEEYETIKIHRFYPKSAVYIYPDFWFSINGKDRRWRYNYFKNNHFDVIHTIGPTFMAYESSYIAKKLNIPLLAMFHTNIPESARGRTMAFKSSQFTADFVGWLTWTYMGPIYWFADLILVPSEPFIKKIQNRYKPPVDVLSRGINREIFNPKFRTRPVDDAKTSITHVGRISIEKNVMRLSRVLSKFQGDDRVTLDVVGDGPEMEYLQNNVKANYFGHLEGKALSTAYANGDIFIFPSDIDTLGNVVLESFASGMPVLCSDKGGAHTIVKDGITGFVCRNDDDYVKYINYLVDNPDKRKEMGKNALEYVQDITWEKVFDKLVGYYDRLIWEHKNSKVTKGDRIFGLPSKLDEIARNSGEQNGDNGSGFGNIISKVPGIGSLISPQSNEGKEEIKKFFPDSKFYANNFINTAKIANRVLTIPAGIEAIIKSGRFGM